MPTCWLFAKTIEEYEKNHYIHKKIIEYSFIGLHNAVDNYVDNVYNP